MNGDGSLRTDELGRLKTILDQARLEHLVVDVSFTYEHIRGMTPATAKVGIVNATDSLRSYDNLLFDIQNERNVQDRRFMSEADVASISPVSRRRIRRGSRRPTTAWARIGGRSTPRILRRESVSTSRRSTRRVVRMVHARHQQPIIRALRSNGKPAYMRNQWRRATRSSTIPPTAGQNIFCRRSPTRSCRVPRPGVFTRSSASISATAARRFSRIG